MPHLLPAITPLRDASIGFGILPWVHGPLWRTEEDHRFTLLPPRFASLEFCIPSGYNFDKASVPAVLWGPPFNYIPDGLCTLPALEHDYLCDLWQRGDLPANVTAQDVHLHFYLRLLDFGVRPSKAQAMYRAVSWFGPGGSARPITLWKKLKNEYP